MHISKADFVESNTDYKKCPPPLIPEYAFIVRSNVGKSSLINMLCLRNGLAKTSSTPGKTQLINHFKINDAWFLVDLPGYGYAKTARHQREKWNRMIQDYILNRENLMNVFLLIDSRIPPQQKDNDFIIWLGENGIAFSIVFTKTDQLTKLKLETSIRTYQQTLQREWKQLPPFFITSSDKKTGRDELLNYIKECNKNFLQ
ncbi:MAG: YihA family ribosome biogenesis GTP-binding protein [Bacteroidetes bacterium]|nr:YihA family ribosome biogenesis GTP-binding protein [Bacteroidota bacterium]